MDLPVLRKKATPSSGGGTNNLCSAKSRGAAADPLSHLPLEVQEKVCSHPCYSEDAHHHFARMHVAVAPACNIQCNYCNRKYDCANESRPGVVSEVLTPDQAVKKALVVGSEIPQLSVVGIAGPGDPLANPERTFATFRMLREHAPDIRLCVSTNGLMLPTHIDELARYNVDHVTITINCTDPDIGAKIYPWVFWKNKRIRGREGVAILIEQQLLGLEMCAARGILVKVNSVMIPGVNDAHLKDVSRVVKAKGAFLHNIMPLITQQEHGTYYGLTGQRAPTHEELQALQDACEGNMKLMRHCRQCRADAVGLLGEDRGADFSLDKIAAIEVDLDAAARRRAEVREAISVAMHEKPARVKCQLVSLDHLQPAHPDAAGLRPVKIAVATRGSGLVNEHFGHAKEFLVYEASAEGVRLLGHRRTENYCSGAETCGNAEATLSRTIKALEGCKAVLCSRIGFEPWGALEAAGIHPNGEHALEPIEDAVRAVYEEMRAAGKLAQGEERIRHSA